MNSALQTARQLQVGLFVETRPPLDHHGHFLAVTGGIDQRVDDLGVGPGAVQGLLDRQHVRVLRGLAQQVDHRRERLERVQQQLIAPLQQQLTKARSERSAQANSTKVDFFTLVRGED